MANFSRDLGDVGTAFVTVVAVAVVLGEGVEVEGAVAVEQSLEAEYAVEIVGIDSIIFPSEADEFEIGEVEGDVVSQGSTVDS